MPTRYLTGDILESDAYALVNTVNTVGVMGKGIALQFKRRFPTNYEVYRRACEREELHTGEMLAVEEVGTRGPVLIVNFPTKRHWRAKSKYDYIETGLASLRQLILERAIPSIAIPPLGCGHGGLDWARVRPMIAEALDGLDVEAEIFEPNTAIAAQLRASANQVEGKLTTARAMLLQAQYTFESQGERTNLFVATKLAYFLQRLGQSLKLRFEPHFYGPYADGVRHVMLHLNGAYLAGMEQGTTKPFDSIYLDYRRKPEVDDYTARELGGEERERLDRLRRLLYGFEGLGALEILSTVDYLRHAQQADTVEAVQVGAARWSDRKRDLLKPRHVEVALERLRGFEAEGGLFSG